MRAILRSRPRRYPPYAAALGVVLCLLGVPATAEGDSPATSGWGIFVDPTLQPRSPPPDQNLAPGPLVSPPGLAAPRRPGFLSNVQISPEIPGLNLNPAPDDFNPGGTLAPTGQSLEDPIKRDRIGATVKIPF